MLNGESMKHKIARVYLSGGMEYAKNEGMDWRNDISFWVRKNLGHCIFNPNIESEKYLAKLLPNKNFRSLKSTDIKIYTKIVQQFVIKDSREIATRSNYIICYWDKSAQRGAGTKGELTIARYFNKPVYFVTHMPKEKIPGWVLGCVTEFFGSFEHLKEFLFSKYLSN
jgi:hypothetical protein